MTDSRPMPSGTDIRARARGIADLLDQIADLQNEVKQLRAAAKSDGYDLRALGKVITELRRDSEYVAGQLEFELVLNTYRHAVGLPTNLADAQERQRAEAESLPEMEPA